MIRPITIRRMACAAALWGMAFSAHAAPVAVNDSYSMNEDALLSTGGGALVSANFESAGNVIAGSWDYLDKIKNNLNGQTPDTYPVDSAARDWKSLLFDKATSTVAGWQTAAPPLQGGGIDGFPGAPNTLGGLAVAPQTQYNVTTYLFRKAFTVNAATAATAQWTLRHIVDDGAIFYINGVEIHRVRFAAGDYAPAGALTTSTSTSANTSTAQEGTYASDIIDLAALPGGNPLVVGNNIFAIELHNGGGTNYTSSDVGIDAQFTPSGSSSQGGFSYLDDPFGTNNPNFATGSVVTTGGNPGGALLVELGRTNSLNYSGGWRQTINLPSAGTARFAFDWKVAVRGGLEADEYSRAVLMVDGVYYGSQGTSPNFYLGQLIGDGVADIVGPWTAASIDIPLSAGNHIVTFGGICNKTTTTGEYAEALFDNIVISRLSGGNGVLLNDTGGAVTAQLVSNVANGTLSLLADGNFSYQPNANFFGTDTFTYRALDAASAQSNVGTVTITVNPVNDAPVAVADNYSTDQQQTLTVAAATGVLANDTDIDNTPTQLSAVLVTAPVAGQGLLTLNANGSFTFEPASNFTGAASFIYRVSDGTATSADVTVTINVSGVGNAPVAVNDAYSTAVNSPLTVTALVPTTVTDDLIPFAAPQWKYLDDGSNQGSAWRAFAFDDALWKTGAAELGYGDGDEATVVEDNPTPGYQTSATDRYITTYFRKNFSVADSYNITALTLSLKHDDSGAVYLNGVEAARTSNLAANADYLALASSSQENVTTDFTQPVSPLPIADGLNSIAVEIHQNLANSSDISMDVRLRATRSLPAGLVANDTDADAGTTLTISSYTQPSHGTVAVNANGTFTYTPVNGYIGPDSFTYRCTDGTLISNRATVNITVVSGPNVRPAAVSDSYNATEDSTLTVDSASGVLANDSDADGDPMTAVRVAGPSNGSLTLNTNGSFAYTPALNFAGTDSFTYTANDAGGPSAVRTVTINVANVNDAPVAVNDTLATDPGVTLVLPAPGVLGNDTDVDAGTTLTAAVVSNPASGTLTLNANGSLNFAPAAGFNGFVTFTYRASDGTANSNTATVTIKVNGRPVANANSYTATEDTTLNIAAPGLLGNDSDPENDPLTSILVTGAAHGAVSLGSNGSFTYTPVANYNGSDSFTYKVNDGARDSLNPATVTISVTAVNDTPVAAADSYATAMDTPLSIAQPNGLLANDSDVDAQPLTAVLETNPANGALSLSANGAFSYTPNTGYTGIDTFTYRATDGTAFSAATTVTLTVGIDLSKIVINEIHYHPQSLNAAHEFIEIFNGNTGPVDVSGWQFDAGVNYTLPAGTLIPGNGYLVVAANPTQFTTTFGSVPVLRGPWIGELSNSGERIRLRDSSGQTVDEATYADEGDWALRYQATLSGQTGWEWYTRADAGGSSLELINPALSNNNGLNWNSSTAAPTPGNPNSRAAVDIAPLMWDLDHRPEIPRSTDAVTVTVNVADEALTPPAVTCFWRVSVAAPGAFTSIQMLDDGLHGDGLAGDGEFGAVIPAQANGTVIEFYTSAMDAGGKTRTWPAPGLNLAQTDLIQECNAFYQVDEEIWSNNFPVYRLIGTPDDTALFLGSWNRNSDAQLNVTLVSRHGNNTDVRYRCGLRVRGAGSRGNSVNNWRLNIPKDDTWNGETEANLNVWHTHLGDLASKMMECAGLTHERSWPVQVRLNTTNRALANSQYSNGYFIHLLPSGSEYLKELRPGDSGGNLYKKVRPHQNFTVHEQSPGGPPAPSGYLADGWLKSTNDDLNDWSDLHGLMKAFTNPATTLPQLESVVNMDYWLRWQAFQVIVNHNETNVSNGSNDDYGLYRGIVDPRFIPLAHDYDTVWGDGGNTSSLDPTAPTATIYQVNGNFSNSSETIPALQVLFSNPVLNQRFKAQLVDLLNTVFHPGSFNPLVDSTLGGWTGPTGSYGVPQAKRDAIKSFNTARRNHILQTVLGYSAGGAPPAALTVTSSLGSVNGFPQTTVASSTGLSGTVDSTRVQKIRIGSVEILPDNYNDAGNGSSGDGEGGNGPAPWSAGASVTLKPGINRLTVEALGPNNTVVSSQTIELLYDDGANAAKSGTLAASETWTAAGGPYEVTASLTVPSGVTLTIEPGTTVYAAAGVTIQATGTGRILAEGTPAARIRFSALPGGGNWGALDIINATSESRFTFCDFENMAGTTVGGHNAKSHVDNSIVLFDNTRWGNTPAVQYISFVNSSFVVSNSIFPTYPGTFNTTSAPEMLHGSNGIPATGYGIFRDCYFGHTWGFNDTIDFTGGNRPGAILQVINCVFDGATDDCLDLDSTDAWVEGNVFFNVHQDTQRPTPLDTSSAISGGQDNTSVSEWTIINNLFYDVDHAVLAKNRNRFIFVNNTLQHVAKEGGSGVDIGAFNFSDDSVALSPLADGQGGYIAGNIIQDCPNLVPAALTSYNPANITLQMVQNLFPAGVTWSGPGSNNVSGDAVVNTALLPAPGIPTVGTPEAGMAKAAAIRSALIPRADSIARCTGLLGKDKGAYHAAGIEIGGEPIVPVSSTTVTLSVGPSGTFSPGTAAPYAWGYTAYKYSLNGGAYSAEIPVTTPLTLTGLAAGTHSVSVLGRTDAGVWQTVPTVSRSFTIDPLARPVVINEVLARNVNAYPVGALRPDYIELRNLSTDVVDISGWAISDDSITLTTGPKYVFPPGTTVPASGYLLLTTNTLGFNLDGDEDEVFLYAGAAIGSTLVDTVHYGFQIADKSIGRTCNGLTWTLNNPTPGTENVTAELGTSALVRINEWSGNNDFIVAEDFVELYNAGSLPAPLSGLVLTDDHINYPQQNVIAPLSFINAGGFVLFRADGNVTSGANHLSFNVSRLREGITLLSDTTVIDHIMSVPLIEDVTGGRASDGGSVFALFGPVGYANLPTPGYSNTTSLAPQQLIMDNLRITEIMYNPPGNSTVPEYIELRNISTTQSIDLSGVKFSDGIAFQWPYTPPGATTPLPTVLAPGAFICLTQSTQTAFNTRWPGAPYGGSYTGALSNAGEHLRLEIDGFELGILDFSYADTWYPITDGGGAALEIVNASAARNTWGFKESWRATTPNPGLNGVFGVIAGEDTVACLPQSLTTEAIVTYGAQNPAGVTFAWSQVSGPGTATFTPANAAATSISFSTPGTYVLRFTATGTVAVSDDVVVTAAESYNAWAVRTLGTSDPLIAGESRDPDKDGFTNLIEFALGMNPLNGNLGNQPVVSAASGNLVLTYQRYTGCNIAYIVEVSSDLISWSSSSVSEQMTSASGTLQTWTATDSTPVSSASRRYMRVRVELR